MPFKILCECGQKIRVMDPEARLCGKCPRCGRSHSILIKPDAARRMVIAQLCSAGLHLVAFLLLAVITLGGMMAAQEIQRLLKPTPVAFHPSPPAIESLPIQVLPPSEAPPLPLADASTVADASELDKDDVPDPPQAEPKISPSEEASAEGGRDEKDAPGEPISTVDHSGFSVPAAAYSGHGNDLKRMIKLVYFSTGTIHEVEEIRHVLREIHMVLDCPSKGDCLMIDSYAEGRWHVVPALDFVFPRGYSLSSKTYGLREKNERNDLVSRMIRQEGRDPKDFEEVTILLPVEIWHELLNQVEAALARMKLPDLRDDAVAQVQFVYLIEGRDYRIQAVDALLRRNGKLEKVPLLTEAEYRELASKLRKEKP